MKLNSVIWPVSTLSTTGILTEPISIMVEICERFYGEVQQLLLRAECAVCDTKSCPSTLQ